VGGVISIPTSLVGGLVDVGVGAVHGPWASLSQKSDGEEKEQGPSGDTSEQEGDKNYKEDTNNAGDIETTKNNREVEKRL